MSQESLRKLSLMASEELPVDCSAEQLLEWFVNLMKETGCNDTLFQLESSLT